MTAQQLRDQFVDFFKKRGHILLSPSSLVPADPTVLFTTAGMQQFKEWFVDTTLAKHKRVITVQPCLRTSDIADTGDETHLTYFEMLGHFSFGDYFKQESIEWGWQFLTGELKVEPARIRATYFSGEGKIAADTESLKILKDYLPTNKIKGKGKADNFWGPTGEEGPCGPNVEFHVGGVEIWNAVFNQYYFKAGKYTPLKTQGVDMGGGLERIVTVVNRLASVFDTDELAKVMDKVPPGDLRSRRIISDHVRAIDGLIKDGIVPDNKSHGAVLRRLIRRAVTHARLIEADEDLIVELVENKSRAVVKQEIEKFSKALTKSMSVYSNILKKLRIKNLTKISAEDAFLMQESYGLPLELTVELARKDGLAVDEPGVEKLLDRHRQKSRAGLAKKFKGGLVEITPETTRLHTTHHLLLAGLRKVLGSHVVQRGSNITSERLRIDFSHHQPMSRSEIDKVEQLVNDWIKADLKVTRQEMPLEQAHKKGALGEFGAHYPTRVSVYSILDDKNNVVSREICGGPHVKKTSQISGIFKITKEESSGAGIRRIKGIIS